MEDKHEFPPRRSRRNPITRAAFRRQVWLQIYLPLAVGVLLLAAAAAGLWRADLAGASAWADASAILLVLPVLVAALIPLVLFTGAIYLVTKLIGAIPEPAHRIQVALQDVARRAQRAQKLVTQPLGAARGLRGALRAALRRLASLR